MGARSGPALEAIFSGDRSQVTDTTVYPHSCICHLRITFPGPNGQFLFALGTGWVLGPRTVITAGHCLYIYQDDGSGLARAWAQRIEVIPGRNGPTFPCGSFVARTDNLRSTRGWVERGVPACDYGAIVLDAPLPDVGRFGLGVLSDTDLEGLTANVVGYPGEYNRPPLQGTLWGTPAPRWRPRRPTSCCTRSTPPRAKVGAPSSLCGTPRAMPLPSASIITDGKG